MKKVFKKISPEYFEDILKGDKDYEIRLNDFDINVGDLLVLEEWVGTGVEKRATGRIIEKEVTYLKKFKLDLWWSINDIVDKGIQIISFLNLSKEIFYWSTKKETLKSIKSKLHVREREIWNVHLGVNLGYEEDGKGDNFLRPVLIYKVFGNGTFWGIPLTTTEKDLKMYFYLGEIGGKNSTAILSQIRLLDNKRLFYKIDVLSKEKFVELNKKFKELLP